MVAPTTPTTHPLSAPARPHGPSHPPALLRQDDRTTTARPRAIAFALVACGLFVLTAVAFAVVRHDGQASPAGIAPPTPEAYTADVLTQMAALSAMGAVDSAGVPVSGVAAGLNASAAALFDAAVASTMGALAQAIAASALPELPTDYVAGSLPEVPLPTSDGYGLPDLPVGPVLGTFTSVSVQGEASPVGSRQGSTPIDTLLLQVQAGLATLEGLLGGLPVGGLPVGGLPVGGGGLPGLPVGGDVPSQAQGAQGTLQPDEEGALLADGHATALLGVTSGAYSSTSAELTSLLAGYQGLVEQVEQTIELTHSIQGKASADVKATLDERLAAIDAQARSLNAQAVRLVAEHRRIAEQAAGQASAAVVAELARQTDALAAAHAQALAAVNVQTEAVLRQADSNKAAVDALVAAASAELGKPGSPADAVSGLAAIEAARIAADLKIDREAKARVQALESATARIDAQAAALQATLSAKADKAQDQVNETLQAALEQGDQVQGYLVAVAKVQAEQAEVLETRLARETLAQIEAAGEAHVADLVRTSLKATESAQGILAATSDLVEDVDGLASAEVGKDLDYIAKVTDDYGRVPTEERKERAAHWSAASATIDGLLGTTLASGHNVEVLAQRTVAAAAQAQADLQAMA
ncbi:MAG TPA: hypothetical protein VM327_02420 [Candidatus Thermoplasmatota archaeon]|nr:hypothetical protein [Candidatus Thermoplasmatota archaeon]